ncbi:MAG TPA: cbb3-type cytochrome c oxidase subunit I, partial [Cyclobacteriaceae bacterium]|nr:cbb3-type cytochrome c oxidase subunit I [Cyclobacteriaceae bacterium]
MQYILPGFLKTYLSFEKTRPLHVSSVVFWILLAAMGGVLHYTREYIGRNLFSTKLLRLQWAVFVVTVLLVLASYLAGSFGGREYWEFPPLLAELRTLVEEDLAEALKTGEIA